MATRKQLETRQKALEGQRNTWMALWKDIAQHMHPHGFRDGIYEANKGKNKHGKIINFTPIEARRTLAAGMMSGITSPSRPWFRLALRGREELAESPDVKEWLEEVGKRLRNAIAKSNAYASLSALYNDIAPFGTGAFLVDEDEETDIITHHFAIGTYSLALSPRGKVDTCFRNIAMTVSQLVKGFGMQAVSPSVRNQFNSDALDAVVEVVHAVVPNDDYTQGAFGPRGKRWASYWWEKSSPQAQGFLRVGGYEEFPIMAPRWEVSAEDAYGYGPGFAALGDCKSLQLMERRSAQTVDKLITPPMSAPAAARNSPVSLLPGEVNYIDGMGAGAALRPAVTLDARTVEVVALEKREFERRIRKAFFADLWLLLSESEGTMTAREVAERREEKLLQLGSVLEALQDELLDPLISRVFGILFRRGRLPEVPEVLEGVEFNVEYISIMAQAQKLLGTTGLERLSAFVGTLAQLSPEALDKLDIDALIDEYADNLGVPPSTVRAEEEVMGIRTQRAEAQQRQQQMQQARELASTGKVLADTSLENESALTSMLRAVGAQ